MLALLVCRNRSCRAAFEAEGSRAAIADLRCEDCDGELHAVGWADGDHTREASAGLDVRRAA